MSAVPELCSAQLGQLYSPALSLPTAHLECSRESTQKKPLFKCDECYKRGPWKHTTREEKANGDKGHGVIGDIQEKHEGRVGESCHKENREDSRVGRIQGRGSDLSTWEALIFSGPLLEPRKECNSPKPFSDLGPEEGGRTRPLHSCPALYPSLLTLQPMQT